MNLNIKIEKRQTDSKIFRHLRTKAGLRMRELAKLIGVNHSMIAHWEQGRYPYPPKRIKQLCQVFRLSSDEYEEYQNGRKIPINYRDECFILINKMEISKLKAIYEILSNMNCD
ncbi:MAG: helix-turn-helix domain-containing protein [Bdellovibrionales bacterium]|nr:helix-turn-helix domain-containing protein [Bdellovibrionales bacterium]